MAIELSSLKESNDFLNLLMDNIPSAVFIVNRDFRLHQFNEGFKMLFSKGETELINELCGNAIGCAYTVDENQLCGKTSNCDNCVLRNSVMESFLEKIPSYKVKLNRDFFIGGTKVNKHFLFSSMYLNYLEEEMILVVVDDITEVETQRLLLLEKQVRLDEDLKSAAEIQRSLLPASFPKKSNCSFASRFIPSERVGGDIFNVFQLDQDRTVVYILDVSGHGVPGAMVTVSVSQMLSPTTGYFSDHGDGDPSDYNSELGEPKRVLETLDRNYPIERFEKYFTISYAVLNHRKSTITYSNAGHPPPILLHPDGRIEYLERGGTIIGLGGIMPFEEEVKTLSDGAKIIFYTDGVTEYENSYGEEYGSKRLGSNLQSMASNSAKEIADTIVSALMEFGEHSLPRDDITVVVVDFSEQ